MPRRRLVLQLFSLLAVLLGSLGRADAAITLNQSLISRTASTHSDAVSRLYISRSDCTLDDALQFNLGLTEFVGTTLQVWVTDASADCSDATKRGSDAAVCWQVFESASLNQSFPAAVRVQDIVKGRAGMSRAGTAADCDHPAVGSGTSLVQITLYFLLVNGNSVVAATPWSTKLDLAGPPAPSGLDLGRGGSLLKLSWNAATDNPDVAGYRIFCDSQTIFQGVSDASSQGTGGSVQTAVPEAGACTTGDASADASDASDGESAECADDSSSGSGGTAGAGGSSGSGGGAGSSASQCNSTLPVGQIPAGALLNETPPENSGPYLCAIAAGNQSNGATLSNLVNGRVYNVSVAAYDVVGNSGPLSSVLCGAPEPVYGFAEAYKSQGGTAGGGFCSLRGLGVGGVGGASGGVGITALLGLAALVGRRSRRRS